MWESSFALPRPIAQGACVVMDDAMWVLGNSSDSSAGAASTAQVFNFTSSTWS